jgi:chromosome segregation protein
MKLAFVEAEGFRGFREKVRIDFAPGFTVLAGRNGVGKSTIFDAVEFALTGTISKYRIEKSGTDKLEDYIWWRGDGAPRSHYVKVGFVDDKREATVYRDRSGKSTSARVIEQLLCAPSGKPANAVKHLCQTSIIRDELITAQSFDLSEGERFSLVYDAQGSVDPSDYGQRAQEVKAVVEKAYRDHEGRYSSARDTLNQCLAELAAAKDRVGKTGDVSAALALIDREITTNPDALSAKISEARRVLTERRLHLNTLNSFAEEERSLMTEQDAVRGPDFQAQTAKLTAQLRELQSEGRRVAEALTAARKTLAIEQGKSDLATSLAELLRHGEHVGRHDGRCPLCSAARTADEFKSGLHELAARLRSTGSDIQGARASLEKATVAEGDLTSRVQTCVKQLNDIHARESTLSEREGSLFAKIRELTGAEVPDARLGQIQQYLAQERSRLINLERAILTVEASRAIEQVAELEAKSATLRDDADKVAERLAKVKRAQEIATDVYHAVQRARVEISDERLAALRPVLTDFYQRLRPHSDWRTIRYSIRGDVTRLLSLRVGKDINPQFVFSSGQRRAAGLAFLLAVHISRPWCRWQSLLLDDPVQHIDDFRSLHLVEVLAALGSTDRQIICGVEDLALADLMCRRLLGSSASDGLRYDLERAGGGSTTVSQVRRVQPMLRGLMRQSSGEAIAG